MLHVREILPARSTLRDFALFPQTLYQNDPNFVLPPVGQQVRGLLGRHNALISNGVQCFLMAYDGEKPVGRLLAGIDFRAVQHLGERQGYISLFDCVNDQAAANALFDAAKAFLKLNGITSVVGPSPAIFDDFGLGLLAEGFDSAPTYLSPYNAPYYAALFEGYGFIKHRDHYAYDLPLDGVQDGRYESVLRRAGKRFGFTVENVNLRGDLKRKTRDMARVVAESIPPDWRMRAPTSESLYRELKRVRNVLWPDYVYMAYKGSRPIGLLLVIPDLNPILRGLKGRMFPVGTFRMLFNRSYIRRLRTVMLYVVPDFQNKGVEAAMIHRTFEAARRNGVRYAEATMVNEQSLKTQLAVQRMGGKVTKVYRQYRLEI
ncbi:MAG: hypothetical protein FWF69_04605 [Firmicutes bacterium]|nr:hypothetical protein [Bacillota bacterium]